MPLSLSYYIPDQVNETHFLIDVFSYGFFISLILSAFNSLVFCYIVTSLLVKVRAFLKRVGPPILSLESVDSFGTSEHY